MPSAPQQPPLLRPLRILPEAGEDERTAELFELKSARPGIISLGGLAGLHTPRIFNP